MLDKVISRLADENESDDNRQSTEAGTESEFGSDPEGSIRGDSMMDSATPVAGPSEHPIELDEVFGLLKNRRRRDVLRHLDENEADVRLGELAEQIAARECEKSVSQINSQERKRVYVGLYQCHLPKLADVGAISYNKPRGIIERGPTFEYITRYLPTDETPADDTVPNHPLVESISNAISTSRFFR